MCSGRSFSVTFTKVQNNVHFEGKYFQYFVLVKPSWMLIFQQRKSKSEVEVAQQCADRGFEKVYFMSTLE